MCGAAACSFAQAISTGGSAGKDWVITLPDELAARLADRTLEPILLGESGASVWRCSSPLAPTLVLKTAPVGVDLSLEEEFERLRWMHARALRVPAVHDAGRIDDVEFLLMEEVAGSPAAAAEWQASPAEVTVALAQALADLHATTTTDCPFDQRVPHLVESARQRLEAGLVREDDFDEARVGRSASDLFVELLETVPESEEFVLVHGDFCLPNVMLQRLAGDRVEVSGLIDCGRAGVGDRHLDLALAVRSIAENFGPEWVQPFLDAYGVPHPDSAKLAFFTLLDEFF